jgi:hypothetical protein
MKSKHRNLAFLLLFLLLLPTGPVSAFTQRAVGIGFGDAVPMGHEWVTRLASTELLGWQGEPQLPDVPDPQDPRPRWTRGRAINLDLSAPGANAEKNRITAGRQADEFYRSRYKLILDAIIGQRWVDIGGYNAITSKECFDSVAQEALEVQADHAMRTYLDRNADGGIAASEDARKRFVQYFVEAAMAPSTVMSVYDGGAAGSTAMEVDRNYFLFGRALHLFQDSFSLEHSVRIAADNYVTVRQVKSYMCAPGSEQHSHSKSAVLDYTSNDVVWIPGTRLGGWPSFKPSNMKIPALVATEATKDLLAAFIRTMGTPVDQRTAVARTEAQTLLRNWLGYTNDEMRTWYDNPGNRGPTFVRPTNEDPEGVDVKRCMIAAGFGVDNPAVRARQLAVSQRKCIYNALPWAGYSDLYDPQMHLWYAWRWRNLVTLEEPKPDDWKIPTLPADSGRRVRIRNVENGQYMSAPDGVKPDSWIYCRRGAPPLDFISVDSSYRVTSAPMLFLSYRFIDGAVKLFRPAPLDPTIYRTSRLGDAWTIQLLPNGEYMWLSGESPYLTRSGNPNNANARWVLEPTP